MPFMVLVRRHMHKLALPLAIVTSLVIGFGGGYAYKSFDAATSAVVEDYALTNVLGEVGYAHYLSKGEFESMRSLLDVSLNKHLSKVRTNGGVPSTPEFEAARIRILNAAAVLWERHPPFQSSEWNKNETNKIWWSEWSDDHKKNLALIQEAKAKCASVPSLNCRAQAPATRLPLKTN